MTRTQALYKLDYWVKLGWLRHLDRAFAHFLLDQEPDGNGLLLWAGALASYQLEQGEVCLDLARLSQHPETTLAIADDETWQPETQELRTELTGLKSYTLEHWKKELLSSSLVGLGTGNTPLVLEGNRLYLRRYWQYRLTLTTAIRQRLQPIRESLPEALQQQISVLFASKSPGQPDWQKIACVLALRTRFTLITGGPGTGKTTTLTKLLALMIDLANIESNHLHKPKILLAAPTGKAAARVSESIANALKKLDIVDDIKQQIPKKASTLHRLLGSRHGSRLYLHHRNNPLVADVVIVDEASMIDLEIMAALVEALPESAQLILLGDKDQLASVEAGSVMGDLCFGAENTAYDAQTSAWIARYTGEEISQANTVGSAINQQTIMLRYSHRFDEYSGIGQLAKAVNAGDANSAQVILNNPDKYRGIKCLRLHNPSDEQFKRLITASNRQATDNNPLVCQGYGDYLDVIRQQRPTDNSRYDQWAKRVLDAFDTFRVLCALRLGPWGSDSLNQRLEEWLFPRQKPTPWYEGRPVMVTRNDYSLGLMNGDIGITLTDSSGKLRVAFLNADSHDGTKILWVSPIRLAAVQTAFAMTVHKSQGSEFNHVALVLPDTRSPVLTRELIYTAITRAKDSFILWEGGAEVFNQAVLASCK